MKKIILVLIFVLTTMNICNAQKIEIKKSIWWGTKYTQNGNRLTMGDLVTLMESNPQALNFIKKARTNNIFALILGGVGGGLIGWPIGGALAGRDANWALAGIGAGLVAIGIPISLNADKNAKKAVDLYNSSLNSTSHYEFKPEFKVVANANGVGLSMNF